MKNIQEKAVFQLNGWLLLLILLMAAAVIAEMSNSLFVALVSENKTTPIINTGTLHA